MWGPARTRTARGYRSGRPRKEARHPMTRVIQNFVNGAHADAADGRTTDVVNPSTGEVYATAALSGPADVDAAMAAAASGLRELARHHAERAQLALLRIADAVEARADELVALREREHRQAPRADRRARRSHRWWTRSASSPAPPACSRALRAGEYMNGHHVDDPPRAGRRRRPGRAVELPDDDGRLEVRPGHRRRQHGRAQAVGHHAGHDRAAGRDRGGVPPARASST